MAGSNASSLTSSRLSGRRDPMLQPQFIRSSTFHWTLAVAGVLAVFVIGLFGFIYWSVDDYLITRSDTMIARQLDFIAGLPGERQLDAIDHNLKQDTRGVHYAALFGADGRKIAGNMGQLPPELGTNDIVRNVPIIRTLPTGRQARVIRAIARRMPGGNTLVIGREVDETREISHVVGQALALGLLPGLCLCLLAGAWLSMRAQKRVEEVNKRVQRIIAGDLRERLPHRNVDEPFSKLAVIVNGMLDEMETMIHALAGVRNDMAHDLRTPLTRARLALERGRTNATTIEQLQAVVDKAVANIDHRWQSSPRCCVLRKSRTAGGRPPSATSHCTKCCARSATSTNRSRKTRTSICGPKWDTALTCSATGTLARGGANLVDNAIKFSRKAARSTSNWNAATTKPSCAYRIPALA